MIVVCVGVCVLWSLVEVHSQTEYPYVSFMGQKLTNHSYVNLTLRNMSNNVLVGCHTDLMTCCNSTDIHQGDWYFPNGERVKLEIDRFNIYKRCGDKQVSILHKNAAIIPSGVFHCDIPTSNTENDSLVIKNNILYVGLYTSGGDVKIPGRLKVSKDTLTCISVGGPATTVTWTRDNVTITQGTETVLDDPQNGGYIHTLNVTVTGRQGGLYKCTVANNKPSNDSANITVQAYDTCPPRNVTAVQASLTSILVLWRPSCNATGYNIKYTSCRGHKGGFSLNGRSTNETMLTDLQENDIYNISIEAKSDGFPSESVILNGVILGQFNMTTASSITIPLIYGGSENVSYEVTWQTVDVGGCSGVSQSNRTIITDGSTRLDIMRLEEDSCYSITVKNNLTMSNNTKVSIVVVTSEAAPSAPPSSVSVSEVNSSTITVQWGPVDCIHRNGDIIGYSVQYGSETVSVSGDSSGGMYVIFGLIPSTTYSIQVAAKTSAGTGPYSTAIYELSAVAAPILVAGTVTATSISLSWSGAGSEDVSYEVMWQTDDIGGCSGGSDMNCVTITNDSTNYDIMMDLKEDSSYTITVIASNSAGSSALSNTIAIMTLQAAPTSPPSSVRTTATFTKIVVQWGPLDCIHRNGNITGYSVRVMRNDNVLKIVSVSSYIRQITISGLSLSTEYNVSVAAVNINGTGAYSNDTVVGTLSSVSVRVISATSVTVNGPSQNYTISYSNNDCPSDSYDDILVTDTMYTLTSLEEGTNYSVTVIVSLSDGRTGEDSLTATTETEEVRLTATTIATAPSAPPSNVSVSEVTSSSITVQWEPVDCIHRNGDITGYSVQYKEVNGSIHNMTVSGSYSVQYMEVNGSTFNVTISGSNITVATVINLMPSTMYVVHVAAINDAGDGVYSDPLTASTNDSTEHSTTTMSTIAMGVTATTTQTSEPITSTIAPTKSENGAYNNPIDNILGAAIIGALSLLIILTIIIITVLLIRCTGNMSGKVKTRPLPAPKRQRPRKRNNKGQEEMEMKGMAEPDDDYYFEDPSNIVTGHNDIPMADFPAHVRQMHLDGDWKLELEYKTLEKVLKPASDVGRLACNLPHNRFKNIFPFDETRVLLKGDLAVEGSDYINASFIDGYPKKKEAYIASQGPTELTVVRFWQMIWEQQLSTIVMLTRCVEDGKEKCEQYWPDKVNSSFTIGSDLIVTVVLYVPSAEYQIRKIQLKSRSEPEHELVVTHMNYTAWPDHGVPLNAMSVIGFIRRVRREHPAFLDQPLMVHCSAGVGRTGTFILLDIVMQQMSREGTLSVYNHLKNMRGQRMKMVQTLTQYVFIHDALSELVVCGETEMTAAEVRTKMKELETKVATGVTGYLKQFQTLEMVSGQYEATYQEAKAHCNVNKNRFPDKLPNDLNRVVLRQGRSLDSGYINASFIDGYKQRRAYIATQGPLSGTVDNLWRMIWEYKCSCIVMLCDTTENEKESSCCFWPQGPEGVATGGAEEEVYGNLRVCLKKLKCRGDITERKLKVKMEGEKSEEERSVTLLQLSGWSQGEMPHPPVMLSLVDMLSTAQRNSSSRHTIIMCSDGVGRSGTFICLHSQLERLKTEGVMDFFQAAKSARIQRAGLVPDAAHYAFCHEVVAFYVDSFDAYANFKNVV